ITLFCFPSSVFARAEESFEKTLNLDKDGKVFLENIAGDITVKGWNKKKVLVKARKVARHKEDLDNVTIDISGTNDTVRIVTRHHKSGWSGSSGVSVDYELFVPKKASVDVETVSGSVEATEIGGYLGITTVSGDLKITDAQDGVRARSVSGDVKIVNSGGRVRAKSISGKIDLQTITGEADLKTVSGDIAIRDIRGSVEVTSVSGDIEMEGVSKAENVEAKTVQGSIEYEGDLEGKGNYELKTHSGDVSMKLPKNAHFELKAKSLSGEIECDFKVQISDKRSDKRLQGVVGKGGARLHLSSFSGDITIGKK
ncbi:MAG: DUF4097 family beta strand repeat-containing protein, partial [Desulfobacterales bacterium]